MSKQDSIRLPSGIELEGEFKGPYSACDVAKHIVSLPDEEAVAALGMVKLIKLAYISHGWLLGATKGERELVREKIEAWQFGPVISCMYHALKNTRVDRVSQLPTKEDLLDALAKSKGIGQGSIEQQLVDIIARSYGKYTASKLVDLTHLPGSPWDQANDQELSVIPKEFIADYYMKSFDAWIKKNRQ